MKYEEWSKGLAGLPADKQKILYVDTEQSPYHCLKVMKRIFQLAGLPTEADCDRIQFLALRKYTPDERIAIIETAIYRTEGLGLVLIDGIRDLVYDINSPGEATCIISKLMHRGWTVCVPISVNSKSTVSRRRSANR